MTDSTIRILDELGRLIRHLTRISGGPSDLLPLTGTQRLALFELADASGPLRLSDLAARMGTSAPTASRAVDVLVEMGHVERLPDPDDRRALQIELTEAGRVRVARRKELVLAAFRPAASTLAAGDREQLAELLARLAGELDRL
ncbi:MAG: MarR family winged helix-turn-helix transcriptional regulator [Gaiellaceae bacterium]